ncbi:MAG: CBS domain-containing protein [Chloroflexi bacterium]|nr:CBS domain-containing protein [Chloroflexota bacterium]
MRVILTHEHADFDAVASLLAAHKLYPDAMPVLPRQTNRNVRDFVTLYRDSLPFRRVDELPHERIDHVIVVDTQTFQPLRRMGSHTTGQFIDHHPRQDPLPEGWQFWGEEVGATTTLLVEQIAERHIHISPLEATLFLLGIYEDTGALTYGTTTPRDVRCAAWLLEQEANLEVVNRFLHHPLTPEQQALYRQLVENSHPYEFLGHSVIIATARSPEYVAEVSVLAHKLRDLYEPEGLFLLVDQGDRIQLVARSTSDAIDVGKVAQAMGGGGHSRAAAALLRGMTLEEAERRLVELLEKHVRPAVTVAEIMSRGQPQTVTPDTTVAEAAERMQRYGFEGFPVVADGQIVGMLTRRQVDRALHHGLQNAPVRQVMHSGAVVVHPEDSVQHLQRVMIEHGWGQVPVVSSEDGRLLGIVTRTDLIKTWPGAPDRSQTLADRMEAALPPDLHALLQEVGRTAHELGYSIYAVGGFVRDLLLGVPNLDLDLVVEGDAIHLARELARRKGGYVRSHRRFGTAKWILPEDDDRPPPVPSLDFVTARIEFYEHPTALPTVEQSNIKQDLHRRDFTINTLAIRLDPDRWGELLDFYGGERDLEEGLIRVLHSLSFVEDPTRILRAVRLEQRLGFRIEPRTEELIGNALDLLERVSGERILHELTLILREPEPERALARLAALGVLPHIHPALRYDEWLADRFRRLRAELADYEVPEPIEYLYFGLWLYRLSAEDQEQVMTRLRLPAQARSVVEQARYLRDHESQLVQNHLRPSQIYRLLSQAQPGARLVFRVATDSWLARQRLALFEQRLQHVTTELDGHDLRRMGLKPGPIYRRILEALLDARLDGQVHTREEEEALVRALIAEEERSSSTSEDRDR